MMSFKKVWGKTKSKVYGPKAGTDYKDNQLRFSLLCLVSFFCESIANIPSSCRMFHGISHVLMHMFDNLDRHKSVLCVLRGTFQAALEAPRVLNIVRKTLNEVH